MPRRTSTRPLKSQLTRTRRSSGRMASLSRSGVEPEPIRLGRFDSLTAREGNLDQILVIHLHGAVSWYYDDRNNIITDPFDRPFNPARTPALLLPDDTKHPANFLPGLDSTWAIFQSATWAAALGRRGGGKMGPRSSGTPDFL
jgi:hypothetical protein